MNKMNNNRRYIRASEFAYASNSVLFEICHTDRNGKRITGQYYTADAVSQRILDLLDWGCYDITARQCE